MSKAVKGTKPEVKKINLKYMRDKDREMVKGIFRFHEVPGGTMTFTFKAYKEDPVENFSLTDGGMYEIPLGVAKHLNKNLKYPIHAYYETDSGTQSVKVATYVRRASFQSLEFIDLDEMAPERELVTVEHVEQPAMF